MTDNDITFERIMDMAPYGITIERMNRLERGQWVVTSEHYVGTYPNMRSIRTKSIYLTTAIEMAHKIFMGRRPIQEDRP